MEKYLTYDKSLDLIRRFGTPRHDVFSVIYADEPRRVARAWQVHTPDKVLNGLAVEIIFDHCALIIFGADCFKTVAFHKSTFYVEFMTKDDLFAESIFQIDIANRTGEIKVCRKVADEWSRRGDILSYGEAHRFLISNRGAS